MLQPGTQVGGYLIESVLGHGGMSVVYEARQLALDRKVALKLLATHLAADADFRERFRHEGRLQATLDHPHIVTVYEAGELREGLYLAMRLIRGATLKDLITDRELDGERSIRLLEPIADALDTAHEAGLIHRDVKPQNILVDRRDHSYLADFGLMKGAGSKGMTRTGTVVGTVDYIAPEQIRGEEATGASDIYAFSALLYETFTGEIPYVRGSDAAVMYAHLTDPPPRVTGLRPDLAAELDEVIARGMAKNPADRYESATDLIREAYAALSASARSAITRSAPIAPPSPGNGAAHVAASPPPGEAIEPPSPTPVAAASGETIISPLEVVASAPAETVESPPAEVIEPAPAEALAVAPAEAVESPSVEEVVESPSVEEVVESPSVEVAESPSVEELVESPPAEVLEAPPAEVLEAPPAEVLEPVDDTPALHPGEPVESVRGETVVSTLGETVVSAPGETVVSTLGETVVSGPGETVVSGPGETVVSGPGETVVSAPPDDVSPPPDDVSPPARRYGPLVAVTAAAAVIAGLVGYLVGGPADEGEPPPQPPRTVAATTPSLALDRPAAWKPASTALTVPGLPLTDAVNFGPGDASESGVVAGTTTETVGPSLLPSGFQDRVQGSLPEGEPVTIGDAAGLRYRDLKVDGFGNRPLSLYVVPTTTGVTAAGCYGLSDRECEGVVGTLAITRGSSVPLGVDANYARSLNDDIAGVNRARRSLRADLRQAKTFRAQAKAATGLATAHRRAADSVDSRQATPVASEAQDRLATALRRAASSYAALARATRQHKRKAYDNASGDIAANEAAIRRAIDAFGALGYKVQ